MANLFKRSYEVDASLSIGERCAYGFGNFGNALVYTIISSYLVFYYTDVVGLNAGIIGSIMLFSRVFDGVTDLIMGYIVDRTKSKKGKGRVWILRICIPYALASILLFAVPINAASTFQYIFVFLTYNIVNAILYTALTVPYNSMGCLLTTNAYERGLLGIFLMGFSCAASVILNTLIMKLVNLFGNTPSAWTITLVVFATLGLGAHMICYCGTVERVKTTEEVEQNTNLASGFKSLIKNKYWVMFLFANLFIWMVVTMNAGSTVYYANSVLNNRDIAGALLNAGNIPQIIFLFGSFILVKKIGKGRTFLIGAIIIVAGFAMMFFFPKDITILTVGLIVKGAGSGIASGCILGITADTIDYSEHKFGIKATGLGSAAMSFAQKVAAGLGGAIMGWVLAAGGYDGSLEQQSVSAITAVKTCFIIIPMILTVAIVIIMLFYDLDKKNNEMKA